MAEVLLCAHRGERVTGDGNTLSAFRNALSVDVDMIETDVRMTGDGVLILMHDEVLDTTTDGTGLIAERTLNEVRAVNAMAHAKLPCAPEPPPTLDEFLALMDAYPDVLLNIEFKDYPTAGNEAFAFASCDRIAKRLYDGGYAGRTFITTFDGRILERVYRTYGRAFRYHGFYPWFIMGELTIDPGEYVTIACMQHRYQTPDGTVVKYDDPLCPKDWFDTVKAMGIQPLAAPSLTTYENFGKAFDYGATLVNADDPKGMLAFLRQRGLHR